jgi:hypothetical protein
MVPVHKLRELADCQNQIVAECLDQVRAVRSGTPRGLKKLIALEQREKDLISEVRGKSK